VKSSSTDLYINPAQLGVDDGSIVASAGPLSFVSFPGMGVELPPDPQPGCVLDLHGLDTGGGQFVPTVAPDAHGFPLGVVGVGVVGVGVVGVVGGVQFNPVAGLHGAPPVGGHMGTLISATVAHRLFSSVELTQEGGVG